MRYQIIISAVLQVGGFIITFPFPLRSLFRSVKGFTVYIKVSHQHTRTLPSSSQHRGVPAGLSSVGKKKLEYLFQCSTHSTMNYVKLRVDTWDVFLKGHFKDPLSIPFPVSLYSQSLFTKFMLRLIQYRYVVSTLSPLECIFYGIIPAHVRI